jgi:peptide-methionine (S)-S-oxide reductase
MHTATFAGGCFWCTEAIFQRLRGVSKVVSGYANSELKNPTYEQVGSGATNAAEAIQIEFDEKEISYEDLLEVYFETHDPTSLNRQGVDVGTQYRSAIFFHSEDQRKKAEEHKAKIPNAVTEISKLQNFTEAEGYHKNYYNTNKNAAYCKLVIDPKIRKLQKNFSTMLK